MMSSKDEKEDLKDTEQEEEEEEEEVEQDNPDEMSTQQKLFYFAKRGDVAGIKDCVQGIDINAVDEIGFKLNPYISRNTALHYAVQSGSLECVKVLYNLEAKLDVPNKLQCTPLHIACALGHSDIAQFLIDMKANIEAKNKIQNTPLHCAVYAGHVETVKVILSQLDEPRDSLLEPNGVGMGPAKYTAHEEMKALLRTYFPKKNNQSNPQKMDNNIEEEAPPEYNEKETANPTDANEEYGD